jgi:hypothetical protein
MLAVPPGLTAVKFVPPFDDTYHAMLVPDGRTYWVPAVSVMVSPRAPAPRFRDWYAFVPRKYPAPRTRV